MFKKSIVFLLTAMLILTISLTGCSQKTNTQTVDQPKKIDYPTKPIKFIVPWAPGGSSDATARTLAGIAEKYLGQPMIIVNRAGANGAVATAEAKSWNADGYQILFNAVGPMTSVPYLQDVPYTIDDFKGVIGLSYEPILLAVNSNSPYKTFDDMKKAGVAIKYGSSGTGSLTQIAEAALFDKAGIKASSVPFAGAGPAVTALLGGHIDCTTGHPGEFEQHIKSGALRYIGVFSPERYDLTANVPTFKEQGQDLDFSVWKYVLVPKGTDPQIVQILHDAFEKMMKDPQFIKYAETAKLKMDPISGDQVITKLKAEAITIGETIKKLDL
ncbi:MAG TPA: tripartite tricarboxylate transporter substrate binding protein [Desulfosporosinus sp.]|nr:tripartite tricarboxylate transporter substrate binding protein [Desulfosporosinus sp.]